jgi:hypothetical protein
MAYDRGSVGILMILNARGERGLEIEAFFAASYPLVQNPESAWRTKDLRASSGELLVFLNNNL